MPGSSSKTGENAGGASRSTPKQAVVVIHGMGEQRPMSTMRGFVEAVWTSDPALNPRYAPGQPNKSWVTPDDHTGSHELRRITTPYLRDEKGVRPWAVPGMAGLQHRIGGIEKEDGTGNISYDPLNHEKMVRLRAEKVRKVVEGVPPLDISNGVDSGDLLILGWGSTYGAIRTAVNGMCAEGNCVGHLHLRYLFPFRKELGEILSRYKRVLIPEMNSGQLRQLIRAEFLIDAQGLNKIQVIPFSAAEIKVVAMEMLKDVK